LDTAKRGHGHTDIMLRGGVRAWAICLLAGMIGCSDRPASNEAPSPPPATAQSVLQRMIDTYRDASSYRDDAFVRLRYRRGGQTHEDRSPVRVAWQAPNRISIHAYEVQVASDGTHLRARIRDRATRDFDGQVVTRRVSNRLTLDQLYRSDGIMSLALRQGLVGYPLQLGLLLADHPLAILMDTKEVTHQLLEPARIDDRLCDRVQMRTSDGAFVFWVDRARHVLRRVEYPIATFAPDVANDPTVSDAQLTVELAGAAVNVAMASDTFTMPVPADAKAVHKFVPPPRELSSDLFGKQVGPFAFRGPSGEVVTRDQLGDDIKVLIWFNNHPACKAALTELNKVYTKYRGQAGFDFLAVCVEPASTTDRQIEDLMKMWQIQIPVVRDLEAYGRDVFHIPWAPTLVVLNGDNRLHIFEVGVNKDLPTELPQVLSRLAAGDDLAAEILARFRAQRERYARQLQAGEPDATTAR